VDSISSLRYVFLSRSKEITPKLTCRYHIVEVVKSMPQIKSLGLLGSLGEREYGGLNTGDSGKLKVSLYALDVTRLRYGQVLIKSA